jgi:hypothetical protein
MGLPVDHIPFAPFLAYFWEHQPQSVQNAGPLAFLQQIGADPLWRGAPCPVRAIPPAEQEINTVQEGERAITRITTPVGTLQMAGMTSESGQTEFLVEHPLKTREDYAVQMWIEENTTLEIDTAPMRKHLDGEGRDGLSLGMLLPRSKSAFQMLVEHHVGTEELVYALVDFPETVETLWQMMVEKNLEAVRLAVEADYTLFTTWEDSSTQNYSPSQYDRYIAPEIAQWCGILRDAGKHYVQHACGHVRALLPRIKETGVLAIESLSPPPTGNIGLAEARDMAGTDMGIIGGLEPTQFLNLSGKALSDTVEAALDQGSGGPFILANADSCPPGVPLDNFQRVADLVKQWKP